MSKRSVYITSSVDLSRIIDLLPSNEGRQSLVTSLIQAYGLDRLVDGIITVERINRYELTKYHDREFVACLLKSRHDLDVSIDKYEELSEIVKKSVFGPVAGDEDSDQYSDADDCEEIQDEYSEGESELNDEDFGLKYDCYPFPFMSHYVILTASSTISTAQKLITNPNSIAINFIGGRHHCGKRKAAGFCYVNDIILGITHLRQSYKRIFYLDLDLHHGDAVEQAYFQSRNVATCSIHRYEPGLFYPGSGSLESSDKNRYNIPTKQGLNDDNMMFIIREIVLPIMLNYSPQCIVIQAGCDGLATDVHHEWNLTIKGLCKVVQFILGKFPGVSTMILGGGGYNHTEVAKCWTYLTASILEREDIINQVEYIPEHTHLDDYEKDGFQFWTENNCKPFKMKDENDMIYLQHLKKYLLSLGEGVIVK
ncbi:Histone deacetylase HOS1 [Spathaspora sp. JA1]|nr:Histone deacetylase HOS1 [Spathaspora sp. JA1]